MAQKVLVQLTDDTQPDKMADETVSFGLDGTAYEIDLTKANADKLRKALAEYVGAGRKVTAKRGRARKTTASNGTASNGASNGAAKASDTAAIREWAKSQPGLTIGDKGRIPAHVREQYAAAQ